MSFGNGASTVRQFRRVSSGQHRDAPFQQIAQPSPPHLSDPVTPPDSDEENHPPEIIDIKPAVRAEAVTKEAILGRRAFSKAVDAAFQECSANTGDASKRQALASAAEAWSTLDQLDPEGELLLLKAIVNRVQADPKLAAAIMPKHVANAQLASLRVAKTPRSPNANALHKSASKSNLVAVNENSTASPAPAPPSASTPTSSPTKQRAPSSSPTKLVMNPQNPHLKTLRRKQSQLLEEKAAEERRLQEKMPGRVEQGQEHVGLLADVLYGRWAEGLRSRWPVS